MDFEPKIIPEGINTSREHPLREFFVLVFGLALVVAVITGLLALSADYLVRFIPLETEHEWFGGEQVVAESPLEPAGGGTPAAEVEQYLRGLVSELRLEDRPEFRFSVGLVESETPNAFVLPGGHIYVTSGLLGAVNSENGLAMVLAHEMAHQYHRHPLRALGRGIVVGLALMAVVGAEGGGIVESFVGSAATLTSLGFNRDQEREADLLGVELLAAHYGHASGAVEFFENLRGRPETESQAPEFLSTHPGVDERIERLREAESYASGDTTPLPAVIERYLESISANAD